MAATYVRFSFNETVYNAFSKDAGFVPSVVSSIHDFNGILFCLASLVVAAILATFGLMLKGFNYLIYHVALFFSMLAGFVTYTVHANLVHMPPFLG